MGHDKGSGKFYLKQEMKESNWLSEMLIFFKFVFKDRYIFVIGVLRV